jgi:hypothetical protein
MKKILTIIFALWSILAFATLKRVNQTAHTYEYLFENSDYQIIERDGFSIFQYNEITYLGIEGAPKLPIFGMDFIVPENGALEFEIIEMKSKIINLNYPILPNPTMVKGKETYQAKYIINEALYNESADVITLGEVHSYRHYDYIPLKLTPFIYDHQKKQLEVITSLKFKINVIADNFDGEIVIDKFGKTYEKKFENYRFAKQLGKKTVYQSKALDFTDSDFWYKIELDGEGVFCLEEELAQLPSFVTEEDIHIVKSVNQNGEIVWQDIPVFWEGERLFFQNKGFGDVVWLKINPQKHQKQASINMDVVKHVSDFKRKRKTEILRDNFDSIIIYPDENTFYSQAQTLADIYQRNYGITSLLISQEDIFDLYIGGNETQETGQIAIRDTLEACYNLFSNLQFVTLMGSGSSSWSEDSNKNKIMTFNTAYSYVSDDRFVDFNPEDSAYVPELLIGRLPAQNNSQMDLIIARIEKYIEDPPLGLWRNKAMFIADDENKEGGYEGLVFYGYGMNHSKAIEYFDSLLENQIITKKIFAFEYEFDQFQNKPDVRDEIAATVNEGCAFWMYVGHGNPTKIGDEDYFSTEDLGMLENGDKLPIFLAASCSVGKYDDVDTDSFSEKMLYTPDGGSIATICATAATGPDFNVNLMQYLIAELINENVTFGEALLNAKLTLFTAGQGSSSMSKYNLLGSPVLSLPLPELAGYISAISDSLQAREIVQISGQIGSTSNNGVATLMVHDSVQEFNYTNYDYHIGADEEDWVYYSVDYSQEGDAFYTGNVSVNNGQFASEIIIPDDISDGNEGLIRLYYYDQLTREDYIAVLSNIDYSSIPVEIEDSTPPSISLKIDSENFQVGDYVSTTPLLIADIEDEHGINLLGKPGHSMLMLIDKDNPVNVSSGFIYDENSYKKGRLSWQIEDLSEGNHLLQLIVFDNFNNFQVAETNFYSQKAGDIVIKDMLFYPNPYNYSKKAKFTFVLSETSDVEVKIYTITGKKIKELSYVACPSGYNEILWNGKDADGDKIANGNYFYKLCAKSKLSKHKAEKIGKLIILK